MLGVVICTYIWECVWAAAFWNMWIYGFAGGSNFEFGLQNGKINILKYFSVDGKFIFWIIHIILSFPTLKGASNGCFRVCGEFSNAICISYTHLVFFFLLTATAWFKFTFMVQTINLYASENISSRRHLLSYVVNKTHGQMAATLFCKNFSNTHNVCWCYFLKVYFF